jgi:hypothetical protein
MRALELSKIASGNSLGRASKVPIRWPTPRRNWLYVSAAFHIICASVLAPVTSHPYDMAVLTGPAQAWLDWGFPLLYNWKFGLDYAALAVLSQGFRAFLASADVPGVMAIHIAWKLPLVAANLLVAGAVYQLGLRLAPNRAAALASLWLLSPVALWVSAGHGQAEALGVLSIFAALLLALDGRLVLAGLITGFGVGIEYFPLAALGSVAIWGRGGQLAGSHPLARYGIGLVSSLVLCFLPQLVDPVVRASLVEGLASSSGSGVAQGTSPLTIWAWAGFRGAEYWPIVFGLLGIASFAAAFHFARRSPAVGLLFISIVLTCAVVLDPNTLAQFSLIASAALWLIALAVPASPLILIVLPAAGAATAFFFLDASSTANAYFFDDWAGKVVNLWPVPYSELVAAFLGYSFSVGLLATTIYAAATHQVRPLLRGSMPALSLVTAAAMGSGVCILLSIWALQPAVWRSALNSAPDQNLPDFGAFVANREGQVEVVANGEWKVSYASGLIAASREGNIQPQAGLRLAAQDLYDRQTAGVARAPELWTNHTVVIPNWKQVQQSVDLLWIEVLVGSQGWSQTAPPTTQDIAMRVNSATLPAATVRLVTPGWALADFQVASTLAGPDGRFDLLPTPSSLIWNGSQQGPWVRILPASGRFHALVNLQPRELMFQLNPHGDGFLYGLPLRSSCVVAVTPTEISPYEIKGAYLDWPEAPQPWRRNPWFQILGATYALVILATTAWLLSRWFRVPRPPKAWLNR